MITFVGSDGAPSFAYHHAARKAATALDPSLANLRAEAAAGASPIPYESLELRDAQAERIRTEKVLSEDERARLLAHSVLDESYLIESFSVFFGCTSCILDRLPFPNRSLDLFSCGLLVSFTTGPSSVYGDAAAF